MRDSARRRDKYRKKIGGLVIPGQAARYSPTTADRIRLEMIVKGLGVTPMLAFSYLAYAEQLFKIKMTHKGQTLIDEAGYTAQHWLNRGLDYSFLNDISEALGLGRPLPGPPTRHEYYITGRNDNVSIFGARWVAQTFTVGTTGPNENHIITSVKVEIFRIGAAPLGDLHADIYATDGAGEPAGPILSHGIMDGNTVTPIWPGLWYEIEMSAFTLLAGVKYALVLKCPGGVLGNNIVWNLDNTGTYAGGRAMWGPPWSPFPMYDAMFEIWGASA